MPPPPVPPFVVLPLAERQEFVDLVAAWGFAEWGHLAPGRTLAQRVERVRASLDMSRLPAIFIALDADGRPAGTAALMRDDLEDDPRNPWLASVYVRPEARRRGVAGQLVRAVENHARSLGFARLYLFTASASALYAGLGWRRRETRDYRGETITVMDRDL